MACLIGSQIRNLKDMENFNVNIQKTRFLPLTPLCLWHPNLNVPHSAKPDNQTSHSCLRTKSVIYTSCNTPSLPSEWNRLIDEISRIKLIFMSSYFAFSIIHGISAMIDFSSLFVILYIIYLRASWPCG